MPRVAIAHEWLVAYGGSERCVEELLALYPDASLLTTIIEPASVPLELRRAQPSLLQRLPGAGSHHEWLLPLMPLAWRARPRLEDVDVVISSSHACAKAVRVAPGVPHLCYCHTPMRYAWNFDAERERFPAPVRPLAAVGMAAFRGWDRRTARRVTRFLANSSAVAERIERVYGRSAQVVHPPVRTDFFTPGGERGDTFLYVGRLVGYKSPRVLVEAFRGLSHRLAIVGDGAGRRALEATAPANVAFLGHVDDRRLRELYRSARALVHPADEDFGIAMAEAQACGTPVIALASGGARDIVEPGRTGWLVERQRPDEFRRAVVHAAAHELDASEVADAAQRFSRERFRAEIREAVDAELRSGRVTA
jgi:glycosyltransferase involved in cell wall biosynthesis